MISSASYWYQSCLRTSVGARRVGEAPSGLTMISVLPNQNLMKFRFNTCAEAVALRLNLWGLFRSEGFACRTRARRLGRVGPGRLFRFRHPSTPAATDTLAHRGWVDDGIGKRSLELTGFHSSGWPVPIRSRSRSSPNALGSPSVQF